MKLFFTEKSKPVKDDPVSGYIAKENYFWYSANQLLLLFYIILFVIGLVGISGLVGYLSVSIF